MFGISLQLPRSIALSRSTPCVETKDDRAYDSGAAELQAAVNSIPASLGPRDGEERAGTGGCLVEMRMVPEKVL